MKTIARPEPVTEIAGNSIVKEELPTHIWPNSKLNWPEKPLFTGYGQELIDFVMKFVHRNPEGVRQCDIARALGWSDPHNWMTFHLLQEMVRNGYVHREDSTKLFFRA